MKTTLTILTTATVILISGCMTEAERLALEQVKQKQLETQKRAKAERDAKEAAQNVENYWAGIAENNYELILSLSDGGQQTTLTWDSACFAPYLSQGNVSRQWILDWMRPRTGITDKEHQNGHSLLETFGVKHMPNAYGRFEKAREAALEIQQMFNESFPDPASLTRKSPTFSPYSKLLKGLCIARMKYLRYHDELCHYYLMNKVGALSAKELADVDSKKISIWLLEENRSDDAFTFKIVKAADEKVLAFASKYMPETFGVYQKVKSDYDEVCALIREMEDDIHALDIVRYELASVACYEKANFDAEVLLRLSSNMQEMMMSHMTMEMGSEAIANADGNLHKKWSDYAKALPEYIRERANGPLVAANNKLSKYFSTSDVKLWQYHALGFCPSEHHGRCVDPFSVDFHCDTADLMVGNNPSTPSHARRTRRCRGDDGSACGFSIDINRTRIARLISKDQENILNGHYEWKVSHKVGADEVNLGWQDPNCAKRENVWDYEEVFWPIIPVCCEEEYKNNQAYSRYSEMNNCLYQRMFRWKVNGFGAKKSGDPLESVLQKKLNEYDVGKAHYEIIATKGRNEEFVRCSVVISE